MGWASYYEDNIDARGASKSRKPTVQIGKDHLRERYVPAAEKQQRIQREIIRQEKEREYTLELT